LISFLRSHLVSILVWACWSMLVTVALWYVYTYGTNVPSWDDWDIVPAMTGRQPVTLEWLWSQHNEHRIPIARLALLAIYRVWPDFRAAMIVNVLLMGSLAVAFIRCAQRLRGKLSLTDIFIPLILLSLGQGVNFVWAWQIEFISSTVAVGVVLLYIASYQQPGTLRTAVAVGCCLVVLALSGAHGVAVIPALSMWLVCLAWRGEPSHSVCAKRNRLLSLGISAACLGLCALYMARYERVPHYDPSSGVYSTLGNALKSLTMAFGPAIRSTWPVSGLLMALLIGTSIFLVVTAMRQGPERVRAAGYLCFLVALLSLALALGQGGRNGFEPRYITLATPILCCVYLIIQTYPPARWRVASSYLLVASAVTMFPANTRRGLDYGAELRGQLRGFETKMANGMPPHLLIQQYWRWLHIQQQLLNDYLPMLRSAHIGKFSKLAAPPAFREVAVTINPAELSKLDWRNFTARTFAGDAYILFRLPQDTPVAGIRVIFDTTGIPPRLRISTRSGDFEAEATYATWPTGDRANWTRASWVRIGQPQTDVTVWIGQPVREIRLYPNVEPTVLRLSGLLLLLPISGG